MKEAGLERGGQKYLSPREQKAAERLGKLVPKLSHKEEADYEANLRSIKAARDSAQRNEGERGI